MTVAGKLTASASETASAPEPRTSAMWISWNDHRRTAGLCEAWDIPLHVVRFPGSRPRRWLAQSLATLRLLARERPGPGRRSWPLVLHPSWPRVPVLK